MLTTGQVDCSILLSVLSRPAKALAQAKERLAIWSGSMPSSRRSALPDFFPTMMEDERIFYDVLGFFASVFFQLLGESGKN